MQGVLLVIAFLLGASIGSFLNVVIYRLPKREPFFRIGARSHCLFCKKTLETRDLIPIVSFLILRGKCRHCKKHISFQYIAIELVTGLAFTAIVYAFGATVESLYAAALVGFIIPLVVIDARHKIIPDALSIPFIVVCAAIGLLSGMEWYLALLGGAIGAGFFSIQWFASKGRWIGSGDIRLGAAMGLLLGWKMLLLALVLAYMLGTVIAVVALIFKRKSLQSTMAFGPYLLIGTLAAYFWGAEIIEWYLDVIWYFQSPIV